MQHIPTPSRQLSSTTSSAVLMGSVMLCFAVAAVGGLSTSEGLHDWYATLDKPPWTPPGWAFGPIWTFLYATMAVAIWDVTRRDPWKARSALALFSVQLFLNAIWSPVFFALQETAVALIILTLLWAAIALCIAVFRRSSRLGSALMVPYLLWVSTAWTLNAWIFLFNERI